jgi:MFS family permease
MHGTPEQVTGIMVAFLVPLAIVSPIAGVFVDRWDARRTMIASDLIRAVLILMLLFANNLWQIYSILFLISTISSFFIPAQSVTIPQIVKPEALLAASSLMQQAFQMVRILSPAAAGALTGWLGPNSCYIADSASFIFSAIMIAGIAVHSGAPHASRAVGTVARDLKDGIRFILTHPRISFVVISLAAAMFATSCFSALVAVFVRDVLHGGTYLFGALGSTIGAGSIIGGLLITKLARGRSQTHLVCLGIAIMGAFILLLTAIPTTLMTLLGCIGIGAGVGLIMITSAALMQGQTPPEMRGRVSSGSMSLITLSQGVSLIFAGGLANRFGLLNVFYASSAMLLAIAASGVVWLRKSP